MILFCFSNSFFCGIVIVKPAGPEGTMSGDIYKEGEEYVIAQIAMHTGNLFLVDDVAIQWVPEGTNYISLHVDNDAGPQLVPIVATRQNGRRYILIPLDDAIEIPTELVETVIIEKDEPADEAK